MGHLVNHANLGEVQKTVYLAALVSEIDSETDTVELYLVDSHISFYGVPVFYHCEDDVAMRSNGALEGATSAFVVGDEVITQCLVQFPPSGYEPLRVIGFTDKPKLCFVFPWGRLALYPFAPVYSKLIFQEDLPLFETYISSVHWEGHQGTIWTEYGHTNIRNVWINEPDTGGGVRVKTEAVITNAYVSGGTGTWSSRFRSTLSHNMANTEVLRNKLPDEKIPLMRIKIKADYYVDRVLDPESQGFAVCYFKFLYINPGGATKHLFIKIGAVNLEDDEVPENVGANDEVVLLDDNDGLPQIIDLSVYNINIEDTFQKVEFRGYVNAYGGDGRAFAQADITALSFTPNSE